MRRLFFSENYTQRRWKESYKARVIFKHFLTLKEAKTCLRIKILALNIARSFQVNAAETGILCLLNKKMISKNLHICDIFLLNLA